MHKHYLQYVEAENEQCIYVMRLSKVLAPLTLTSSEAKDREGQENRHDNYKHQLYAHRLL